MHERCLAAVRYIRKRKRLECSTLVALCLTKREWQWMGVRVEIATQASEAT